MIGVGCADTSHSTNLDPNLQRGPPVHPLDVLGLLGRDNIPVPAPEPDGALRPPVRSAGRAAPGRTSTSYARWAGHPGAPTLLLVHGWVTSGGLELGTSSRHSGRDPRAGPGPPRPRARDPVRVTHPAAGRLRRRSRRPPGGNGSGTVLVAGYSMGGPVAQLLYHEHPERVSGIMLSATARGSRSARSACDRSRPRSAPSRPARGWAHVTGAPRTQISTPWLARPRAGTSRNGWSRSFAATMCAISSRRDTTPLASTVDPGSTTSKRAAVVVTTRDRAVAPQRQIEMAKELIEGT